MANINEDLPRLEYLVHQLKMLQPTALSQDIERRKLQIAVDLARILVES